MSRRYTVADGLQSNTLYQVRCDQKGYIWITSDRGVSRFDGTSFSNFTDADGLCEGEVFGMSESDSGDLWFYAYSRTVGRYKNGKFDQPAFNRVLKKSRKSVITDVIEQANGDLYISNGPLYLVVEDSLIKQGEDQRGVQLKKLPEGKFHVWSNWGEKDIQHYFEYEDLGTGEKFKWPIPYLNSRGLTKGGVCLLSRDSKKVWITIKRNLLEFDFNNPPKLHRLYQVATNSQYEDTDGDYWVGSIGEGVWMYPHGNFNATPRNFFRGQTVTGITQDHEGGFWVTTRGDGLYYFASKEVFMFSGGISNANHPTKHLLVDAQNKSIFTYNDHGILSIISCEKEFPLRKSQKIGGLEVKCPFLSDRAIGFYTLKEALLIDREDHSTKLIDKRGLDLPVIYQDKLAFIKRRGFNGISIIELKTEDSGVVFKRKFDKKISRLNRVTSTKNGVFLFHISQLNWIEWESTEISNLNLTSDVPEFFTGASLYIGGDSVWVGSQGKGLFLMDGPQKVAHLTVKDGLPSDFCYSLFKGKNGTIWMGSQNGLARIQPDGAKFKITNYNHTHGLPSDPVYAGGMFENQLFLSTQNGICFFQPDKLTKNTVPPMVYITEMEVNQIDTNLENGSELKFNQNLIEFHFRGLAYRNAGKLLYRYRLLGLENQWDTLSESQVIFSALNDGEYRFEVQACNSDGVWSEKAASLNFFVLPPFWERWWFVTGLIVVLSLLAYLSFILRIQYVRKRLQLVAELNNTRIKAFGAQMNPHFIYNSLNSVVQYIARNDQRTALSYLSKFGRLMRQVFDNSQDAFIPLEGELEALGNYLELESIRLQNRFSYKIFVADEVEGEGYLIPSLLLQPFVENAIWHGISPRLEGGQLTVSVDLQNEMLRCTITDNGVGRKASFKVSQKQDEVPGQKARSSQLIRDRILLMKSLYRKPVDLQIEDLYENGSPAGTRVTFLLPEITNHDPITTNRIG